MNIEDLTLKQIRELQGLFGGSTQNQADHMQSQYIGKYVVVRTYSAGVHAGILQEKKGREARLVSARRIWSWTAASKEDGALSAVARIGVGQGSKIAGPVDSIELTEAIEVLPTTDAARSSIEGGSWQK